MAIINGKEVYYNTETFGVFAEHTKIEMKCSVCNQTFRVESKSNHDKCQGLIYDREEKIEEIRGRWFRILKGHTSQNIYKSIIKHQGRCPNCSYQNFLFYEMLETEEKGPVLQSSY